VHAAGAPAEVLTTENLTEVYGFRIDTAVDDATGRVRVIPRGRHHERTRRPEVVPA
jgi:iron complex transport system ATP-binding protein